MTWLAEVTHWLTRKRIFTVYLIEKKYAKQDQKLGSSNLSRKWQLHKLSLILQHRLRLKGWNCDDGSCRWWVNSISQLLLLWLLSFNIIVDLNSTRKRRMIRVGWQTAIFSANQRQSRKQWRPNNVAVKLRQQAAIWRGSRSRRQWCRNAWENRRSTVRPWWRGFRRRVTVINIIRSDELQWNGRWSSWKNLSMMQLIVVLIVFKMLRHLLLLLTRRSGEHCTVVGDKDCGSGTTRLQSVVVVDIACCQCINRHCHVGCSARLTIVDDKMTTASLRVTTFTTPTRFGATLLQTSTQRAVCLWRKATVKSDEREKESKS